MLRFLQIPALITFQLASKAMRVAAGPRNEIRREPQPARMTYLSSDR